MSSYSIPCFLRVLFGEWRVEGWRLGLWGVGSKVGLKVFLVAD